MQKKIIILSGYKSCGKGILAEHIRGLSPQDVDIVSCKDKLYELVCSLFCITVEQWEAVYDCRVSKEVPCELFEVSVSQYNKLAEYLGKPKYLECPGEFVWLSPREALIFVSEIICKPIFGANYFGKARLENVIKSKHPLIIDDSGAAFEIDGQLNTSEVDALVAHYGQENILLVRVHRDGCISAGDSRRYFPDGVIDNTIDVYNDFDLGGEEENIQAYLKNTLDVIKSNFPLCMYLPPEQEELS